VALAANRTGNHNTAFGDGTLASNRSGNENVALGFKASGAQDTAVNYNTTIGSNAGRNNKGNSTVLIGTSAGFYNKRSNIIAIGDSALFNNGTGVTDALQAVQNTAVGSKALFTNTIGAANSTLGNAALFNNVSGNKNIAIGLKSLYGNIIGNYNVAIGDSALYFNSSLSSIATQGLGNIGIGSKSMFTNIYGSNNIALGREALAGNSDGDNNIGIGYRVGNGITNGSNNIFIGNSAGGLLNVSNKLFIENSNADKDNALIFGDFAADSLNLNADVTIRDFTRLGSVSNGAPAVKMKKILVASGPAVNGNANYPFGGGITDSKIIGVNVLMTYSGTTKIAPGYIDVAGYEYNIQVQFNGITVINKNGNSANIGGKPISILITYEE
jgi:hypothetical protein